MTVKERSSRIGALHDELSAAGDSLVGNADVLRGILAGSGDCIKILDLEGRLQFMSEGGKRVMEVDDFAPLKGCPWPDFWAGPGHSAAISAVATAIAGGIGRFKGPANTAKGTSRYWDVQVSPIFGEDGKPSHLLSISRDITEEWLAEAALKEAAERQIFLTQELEHRIKNTLTMVGAIANQTMPGAQYAVVRQAFIARLIALGHAHDILTRTSWTGAPISEVVESALKPHMSSDGRIAIDGAPVQLMPKQALGLALAVHELATNAIKYGALSNSVGTVRVTWSNETKEFRFIWSEQGGPTVSEPTPAKMSFGSRLVERMLANDFGGTVNVTYAPTGLRCELVAPELTGRDLVSPTGKEHAEPNNIG